MGGDRHADLERPSDQQEPADEQCERSERLAGIGEGEDSAADEDHAHDAVQPAPSRHHAHVHQFLDPRHDEQDADEHRNECDGRRVEVQDDEPQPDPKDPEL